MCNRNPILEESNNGLLAVNSFLMGSISVIRSAMGPHDREYTSLQTRHDWISDTWSLADKDPRLVNPTGDQFHTRDLIWKALTKSKLPENFAADTASDCFSVLLTPQGRRAVHNLELIRWIDTNAWLKIEGWTLREWSRLGCHARRPNPSVENINVFIRTLEHVLESGMRLILVGLNDIGMVHPNARVSDKIYCIEGCSAAVVLREDVTSNGSTAYRVIGGA
jgi:hypothetical protein